MALIFRLDIDRPYGKRTMFHQLISRISSDFYFPKIPALGYLNDLKIILELFNESNIRAHILFRKCSLPSKQVLRLLKKGNHIVGLHLENSRNFSTFYNELIYFEKYFKDKIMIFSKHGSGKYKYGYHHYPEYEPEKYIKWGNDAGMRVFLGNGEDPSLDPFNSGGLLVFPSAFWLEPFWRDTSRFDYDWLVSEAKHRDIVLLFHPDNITCDPDLFTQLKLVIKDIPHKVLN